MRGWRVGVGFGFVVLAGLPAGRNAYPAHSGTLRGAMAGATRNVVASTTTAPAATSTTGPLPGTTVPPGPPPPGATYTPATWELSGADLDEPFCPERSEQGPGSADGDPDAAIAESTRLQPMIGVVLAYGTEYADSFSGYGLHWHAPDDASVFVSFTHGIAAHRAALLEVVPFPDELIVCRAVLTGEDIRVLEQQLVHDLEGHFVHVGRDNGRVSVGLYAPDEALAADLVAPPTAMPWKSQSACSPTRCPIPSPNRCASRSRRRHPALNWRRPAASPSPSP